MLALAVGGFGMITLLLGAAVDRSGWQAYQDYVLFGLFAAAVLFLFAVVRIGEAPTEADRAAAPPPAERPADPRRLRAECYLELGDDGLGRDEAELSAAAYGRALDCYVELGDHLGQAEALRRLGRLARRHGRLECSRQHYAAARRAFRRSGDRYGEGTVLLDIGGLERERGREDAARAAFRRARVLFGDVARRLAVQPHRAARSAATSSPLKAGANK